MHESGKTSGIVNMPDQPARVLVAEDHHPTLGAIRCSFEHAGFNVATASNGTAAWELLRENDFDLVCTDHDMPGMTGLELCEAMHKDPRLEHIPVILLSGKATLSAETQFRAALRIGAIMHKPFSPRALLKVAERLLAADAAEVVE